MPGYRSPERLKPASHRAKRLVEDAHDAVSSRWSHRSWTEVGYSVLGSAGAALTWSAGIGLKIAINMGSGLIFGRIGEQLIKRAESAGYGPEQLGRKISDQAVEYFWPLVEDVIKGEAEDKTKAVAGKVAEGAASPQISSAAAERAKNAFEEHSVNQFSERMQRSLAELMLRSAALERAIAKGNVPYCDHVHYMALEMYQIDALRAEVIQDAAHLEAYAKTATELAQGIKVRELKRKIRNIADQTVKSSDVAHYNAYSWNALRRSGQCSENHCWGPHTDQL